MLAIGGVSSMIGVSYGNTIKKQKMFFVYFYEKGVRMFVLRFLKQIYATLRKQHQGHGFYVTHFNGKGLLQQIGLFLVNSVRPDIGDGLACIAKELDLIPYCISFHVGSQQRDMVSAHGTRHRLSVKVIFERLKEKEGTIFGA